MPIGDFDYKVMLYIRSADDTVTMNALVQKFGDPVRSTVESLCKDKLLYWDRPIDNLWGHDDAASKIELTAAGERDLNNYVESERLTTRERWKERVWGIAATLISEAIMILIANAGNILRFLSQFL